MYKKENFKFNIRFSGCVIRQIISHFNTSAPLCLKLNFVLPTIGPRIFWLSFSALLKTSASISIAVKVFMASSKLK